MSLAIIAVDPGKNTGVAESCEAADGWSFNSWELGVKEFFAFIENRIVMLLEAGYEVRLVAEAFIITMNTAKNTQSGWSLEMIGVLKFLAAKYGLDDVKIQMSNVAKTFGSNDKLKIMGWYRSGTVDGVKYAGHANDAARHLATYAAQRGILFSKTQLIAMAEG